MPVNDPFGPAVAISGVASFGTLSGSPTGRLNKLYELVDNISHQNGAHAFRVGADFLYNGLTITFPQSIRGSYSFPSLANFLNGTYNTSGFTQPAYTFGYDADNRPVSGGNGQNYAYDVRGNLWVALAGLGGIIQIDRRGLILGFVPIPNGDNATTNFAFGGPDNRDIFLEGAISGTFWRFKAPFPGLIGPGGGRLPAQP